jgi:hypothetical protein
MKHPQFDKKINENYYGSELNKLVSEKCRKDMVVNNIDLIFNYYKDSKIRIVESKHLLEKISQGQKILLDRIDKQTIIECFVVFGNYPYEKSYLYSLKTYNLYRLDYDTLIKFLDNKVLESDLQNSFVKTDKKLLTV